jgi:hypothetical protein
MDPINEETPKSKVGRPLGANKERTKVETILLRKYCRECKKYHSKSIRVNQAPELIEMQKNQFLEWVEAKNKKADEAREEAKKAKLEEKLKQKNIDVQVEIKQDAEVKQPEKVLSKVKVDKLIVPDLDQTKHIELKQGLDLNLNPGTGNTTLLIGPSKKGKSTLLIYIYKKYFQNSDNFICILFTDNPQLAIYSSERLLVCNKFEPELVNMAKKINTKTNNNYNFVFLIDDIVDIRSAKKFNSTVIKMFLTFRNANISTICCLQDDKLLEKNARYNVNNLILFQQNNDEAAEKIIKSYIVSYAQQLGIKGTSLEDKIIWYKNITKDHSFIYIDNINNTISINRVEV